MKTPRALFAIPNLDVGGAQRVFTNVLNELDGRGVDLHLAFVRSGGPLERQVSPNVRRHDLAARRAATALPRLQRLIRRLRPDVVFSTAFRMNLGILLMRPFLPPATRIVIREVNLLSSQVGDGWRGSVLTRLGSRAFRSADAIFCQSEFMREELYQALRLPRDLMRIVRNPVPFEHIQARSHERNPFAGQGPGPHVLAVGRLDWTKGFDRLVAAFPKLRQARPSARLWIAGEGEERDALARQASDLGLASAVHLIGVQQNPYCWMRHADLLAVPSWYEGTPNVVLEGIACGCPLVVLEHPGGTRELMQLTEQEWRVVSELDEWRSEWFHRPSPVVEQLAREAFEACRVVTDYLELIDGTEHTAAQSRALSRLPSAA